MRRRCRVGQDPGAHAPRRALDQGPRRLAVVDPGDHLHQQGRQRDEGARGRAPRGPDALRDVDHDVPQVLRADPALRGRSPRLDRPVHDLRRPGRAARDRRGHERPRHRRQAPDTPRRQPRDQPRQGRADRPRDLQVRGARLPRDRHRPGLRGLPAAAAVQQRVRLRRPDRQDRRAAPAVPGRPRRVPVAVPLPAGRRVPGHQPRAVPPGQHAGGETPQHHGRRRR